MAYDEVEFAENFQGERHFRPFKLNRLIGCLHNLEASETATHKLKALFHMYGLHDSIIIPLFHTFRGYEKINPRVQAANILSYALAEIDNPNNIESFGKKLVGALDYPHSLEYLKPIFQTMMDVYGIGPMAFHLPKAVIPETAEFIYELFTQNRDFNATCFPLIGALKSEKQASYFAEILKEEGVIFEAEVGKSMNHDALDLTLVNLMEKVDVGYELQASPVQLSRAEHALGVMNFYLNGGSNLKKKCQEMGVHDYF